MRIEANNNFIPKINNSKNDKRVSFTGMPSLTGVMQYMQNNEIVEKAGVDVVSMIVPRTAVDASRNPYAGFETFAREMDGNFRNCFAPGLLAYGVANLVNKNYKSIWADNHTIDILKSAWDQAKAKKTGVAVNSREMVDSYIKTIFNNSKGLNGSKWNSGANIPQKAIDKMTDLILTEGKTTKQQVKEISDIIGSVIKARQNFNIEIDGKTLHTNIDDITRDAIDLGKKIFANPKVQNITEEIKNVKTLCTKKSLWSLLTIGGLGYASQFINNYITKLRTGSDQFVGYSDFGAANQAEAAKERKDGLLPKKIAAMGMLSTIAVATMGGPRNFLNKIEFKGPYPHVNQLRFIYALTLLGRFSAARDNNELKETVFRDTLGFLNWLVLGGIVSKAVAQKLDPTLIHKSKALKANANIIERAKHWLVDTSIKSYDEIKDTVANEALRKNKYGKLTIALMSGIVYSCLALGVAVPLMNKRMTEKARAKEMEAAGGKANIPQQNNALNKEVFQDFANIDKINTLLKSK